MRIFIPNNNISERKYIIDILLKGFLGLIYTIEIKDIQNYEIVLENGNKLIIEDHFFNKLSKDLEYLDEKNIPQKVKFAKNDFIVENDIPIIYGTNKILITNHQLLITLTCGIDIFASSFFMLARWEEYVNKIKDKHNRFPAYASLAYKNNFLDRAVVNEYIEMFWNMLKFLGCKQERKKREFTFVLTHDVDHSYRFKNYRDIFRILLADLLIRKDIKELKTNLHYIMNKKDPFDTYDCLMDISEMVGVKSYFFLHSSNSAKQDVNNDKFLKEVAKKILDRGHYLGYHPSYNAYNNLEIFIKDKEKIENIIEYKLTFGRQHYLRFEVPTTWQIWEEAGMEWDSTLGYADKEGFRCGVCYPYSVFDIIKRKKLQLKEKPLIAMEGSFIVYQSEMTPKQIEQRIKKLIEKIKKYNGEFIFLWHNSSFGGSWKKYEYIYEKTLKSVGNEKN